jgi:hypothetical protein
MSARFNPPPNWPAAPEGWVPPQGWQPDPAWGPAPAGWNLWVDEAGHPVAAPVATPAHPSVPAAQTAVAAGAPVAQRNWFMRHKILTGLGALALIIIISSVASGGSPETTAASAPAAAAPAAGAAKAKPAAAKAKPAAAKAKALPGLRTKVRDGKFEFTVSSVKCGVTSVGDDMLGQKAQGQYCLVKLTVTNIGNEAQSLFADNQYLFDATGKKFSADSTASIYAGVAGQTIYKEINPGNAVTGVIYYDVPKTVKPAKLELHDSAFSGGVTVSLR